ncbi:MAG: hypothetical protein U0931_39470 [Vulcanimicrobiota bacterium]
MGELVSKTVGPTGGTIEAVATDGTRYVLTIPAGALSQDTPLTMLPVAVSGQLGLPIELPVAVKISPSGTQFTGGAELAITLPAGTDMRAYHAYVMEDSGTPMSLAFAKIVGQTITFRVFHLTVPGASPGPIPNSAHIGVTSAAQVVEAQMASVQAAFDAGRLSITQYSEAFNSLTNDYFEQTLKPLMEQTAINGTDANCQFVLREAARFESFLQFAGVQNAASFTTRLQPLYVNLIKRGITAVGVDAVAADDYLRLKPVGDFYLVQAQLKNLDTEANGLDAAKVKSMIPLTVVLEILEKPAILDENETGKIRIKAGYRLGSNPVKFTPRVFAQLDMTGGQIPNPQVNKLKEAEAGTGAILFNDITLSPNSQKINVHLTGIFKELVVGSAGLIETPAADFVIEGKLKVAVSSGTGSGGTTPVTATVRKGNAPLASAPVTFDVVSGGGSVAAAGTTDDQGIATVNYVQSGSTSPPQVAATVSDGAQTATAVVTLATGSVTTLHGTGAVGRDDSFSRGQTTPDLRGSPTDVNLNITVPNDPDLSDWTGTVSFGIGTSRARVEQVVPIPLQGDVTIRDPDRSTRRTITSTNGRVVIIDVLDKHQLNVTTLYPGQRATQVLIDINYAGESTLSRTFFSFEYRESPWSNWIEFGTVTGATEFLAGSAFALP